MSDDRVNTFVSARTAAPTQANFTRRKVKVVMNDNEVVEADIKLVHQPNYRLTA
ncbi:hypothetical protein ES703_87085 [subsurface metagenome]